MAVRDDPPAAVEEIGRGRVGPIGSFLFEASGQRKGSGSYYTPRTIAAFLAREALEPLIEGRSSEEILLLRVIDPSMGSGAFLVPAVHFLAEAYGQARIAEGLDADNLIDDEERAAYRRLVVERCIYGVDKNPMAVELAKVSLWLATASKDRPLSFLDAKLRCGDSPGRRVFRRPRPPASDPGPRPPRGRRRATALPGGTRPHHPRPVRRRPPRVGRVLL